MTTELTTIANQAGLAEQKSKQLLEAFAGLFQEAKKIVSECKDIQVKDENDIPGMKEARVNRLRLREVRIEVEQTRKELKEQSLRESKAIDGISNVIKALIVPVEEHLEEQEKFAEILQKQRLEKRFSDRILVLSKFDKDLSIYNVREMTDELFSSLVTQLQKEKDENEKARIEEERLAAEEEKIRERKEEETRLEVERLRKEAEEKNKQIEADRKKHEEELRKQNEIQQAKINAEKKAREQAEAKLKAEQELQEKKRLEEKQAIEAKKRLEEEQQRQALLAPDKEKLLELANLIDTVQMPAVQSNEANSVIRATNEMLNKVTNYIREKAKTL